MRVVVRVSFAALEVVAVFLVIGVAFVRARLRVRGRGGGGGESVSFEKPGVSLAVKIGAQGGFVNIGVVGERLQQRLPQPREIGRALGQERQPLGAVSLGEKPRRGERHLQDARLALEAVSRHRRLETGAAAGDFASRARPAAGAGTPADTAAASAFGCPLFLPLTGAPQTLFKVALIRAADERIFNLTREGVYFAFKRRLVFGACGLARVLQFLPEDVGERTRRLQSAAQTRGASALNEAVGVLPGREERERQTFPGFEERRGAGGGAGGGALSAVVAVQAEDGLVGEPPQEAQLFFADGGAEGGDDIFHAGAGEGDGVHVSFDDIDGVVFAGGGGGAVYVVEGFAFAEEDIFGAVEVFGACVVVHGAGAEGDDALAGVVDGKDDAVAEEGVEFAGLVVFFGEAGGGDVVFGAAVFFERGEESR